MASESVVCGFCLEKDEQLVDPRSLPCHHVHCYPCLVGDFEANRIVRCGTCKAVFDVTLTRLPSLMKGEGNFQLCDTCVENKTEEELAVSYCTSCSRKMCTKHLEPHGQFYPLHKDVIDIKEYQNKANVLIEHSCSTHENKPITVGCSTCYQVLCVTCMDGTEDCIDGSGHATVNLNTLVNLLKDKRDKVTAEAWVKEGELSTLLKCTIKILSDYEKKTKELVDQLHRTRDKQMKACWHGKAGSTSDSIFHLKDLNLALCYSLSVAVSGYVHQLSVYIVDEKAECTGSGVTCGIS
ncbi:E3 ubiquitin-protein ligase TRIM56-like [Watersipora subatra]|uniref:E3 ubiquitin-protein ligase TRIM56-like n=1 Tax=Watersipora subatra TaxID=2589382 RepID=UPI00355C12CD